MRGKCDTLPQRRANETRVGVDPQSSKLLPVILAGGAGTRLWPRSRELYPKQFLRLVGSDTLLQQTLSRLGGLDHEPPIIVCNDEHRFIVAEQCRDGAFGIGAIVLEPVPRNTGPAAALAALRALGTGADPVLLVLPADHLIADTQGFHAAVRCGLPFAEDGRMVVFGVTPSHPETGYGYIRAGQSMPADSRVATVAAFNEKPSREVAERHLAEGGWSWNSGMFLFRASAFLDELKVYRPKIYEACAAAVDAQHRDLDFERPGDAFRLCPSESIDRAVMEKTRRAVVVQADMGWSDIGTWDALSDVLPCDEDGNTTQGDVIAIDSRNCHLSASNRLVAAVGIDGLVVAETPDAVLVAAKGSSQKVSAVVGRLRDEGRPEHRKHTTDYRPWGRAETLEAGDGFLVKRLTVAPGKALSLQMHRYRSEHWVVVSGVADVERNDDRFTLTTDESTYIPTGAKHRLTNAGPAPLVIIEVQTGPRLSEDDIVRFDDPYGRV